MTIVRGTVQSVAGGLIYARLPPVRIGEGVRAGNVAGRVEAFHDTVATIAAFGSLRGIAAGATVATDPSALELPLGMCALGRAIDASGVPLDSGPTLHGIPTRISSTPVSPDERQDVRRVAWTGVRAIDGLLPFARGARIGIFGAPGTGKSSLVHTIVDGIQADAVVVALVGERGREAEEWIRQRTSRLTIVCATSDRSAPERVRAAEVAFAQANALRARGLHVVLVLDSLARYANGLREIAIATGEAAGRGGFPPSVFARVARIVEIAGATRAGAMTLLATILDDGDERDPVSDAARSLLDGHVMLSQKRAGTGKFPAIDICASASRTMSAVAGPQHLRDAQMVREALSLLARTEEIRSLGIVAVDARMQQIVAVENDIENFLCQSGEHSSPTSTLERLGAIANAIGESVCV